MLSLLLLSTAYADDFWATWGDGKAEVDTYTLTQPRYGALNPGDAVLIFVTEDFSWSERVKADPGEHPDSDLRKVIKLNAVRDFDTGIYTYHVMTSTFLRLDGGDGMAVLDPIKLSFSAQEWCGMVYDELVMGPGTVRKTGHTYFDSDTAPPSTTRVPPGTVFGDSLPILIRGLKGDLLAPGASRTAPYYPTAMDTRFAHTPARLGSVTLTRAAGTSTRTVPAGTFTVETWTAAVEGGETTTWYLEADGVHRIVAWESGAGEKAELKASERMPYWSMHAPENLNDRTRMGL